MAYAAEVAEFSRYVSLHWTANLSGVATSAQSRATSPTPRTTRERDQWKIVLERSLNAWRNCTQGAFTANPSTIKFNRSSMTLYRIAHVTLYTNIIDLQILAGLPKIMGKPVKEEASINVLLRLSTGWAGSDGATKSVISAVKLLNETLFQKPNMNPSAIRQQRGGNSDANYGHLQRMDYMLDGVLHGKWCLYLATLTLWAWGVVTNSNPSREGSIGINGNGYGVKMEDG